MHGAELYMIVWEMFHIKPNLTKKQNSGSPQIPSYAGVSKAARACEKEEIKNYASLLNSALKKLEKNASL